MNHYLQCSLKDLNKPGAIYYLMSLSYSILYSKGCYIAYLWCSWIYQYAYWIFQSLSLFLIAFSVKFVKPIWSPGRKSSLVLDKAGILDSSLNLNNGNRKYRTWMDRTIGMSIDCNFTLMVLSFCGMYCKTSDQDNHRASKVKNANLLLYHVKIM